MFFLPALFLTFGTVFVAILALALRSAPDASDRRMRRAVAALYILFIPVFSFSLYAWLGHPQLPDRPYAERAAAESATAASFISNLQSHLEKNPDDMRGWIVLARIYRANHDLGQAISAYRRVEKGDFQVMAELGLADALIEKTNDGAAAEAQSILQNLLKQHPQNLDAKFLLARSKARQGDAAGALADFEAMRDGLEPGNPLRIAVEREIALVKTSAVTAP